MKGMLVKDLKLMKMNQKFFLLVIAIAFFVSWVNESNPMFMVSYLTILISMLTISTISYDEYDHGFPFLFTLPITRVSYAIEKYVLSFLLSGSVWLLSTLAFLLLQCLKHNAFVFSEALLMAFYHLLIALIVNAFMIPCQLKFGTEKAAVIRMLIFGIGIGVATGLFIILNELNLSVTGTLSLGTLACILTIGTLLMTLISVQISIRIMKKKEF